MKVVFNNKNGIPVISEVATTSKRASRQRRDVISQIGDVPFKVVDDALPSGEVSYLNVAGRHDFPDYRLYIGNNQVALLDRSGGCFGMIIRGINGFSDYSIRDAVSFGTNERFCENLQY